MVEYGIIADDLTGACDSALEFKKAGFKTASFIYTGVHLPVLQEFEAVAVSTDSRDDSAKRAVGKVKDACQLFLAGGVQHIFKKMDSTWRGNIGSELEVTLQELNMQYAFVSSSFPEKGRFTVNGYLLEGQKSDSKAKTFVPGIIASQTKTPTVHIDLADVQKGPDHLLRTLKPLMQSHTIFLLDSACRQDLQSIVEAGLTLSEKILFCGSAGLAGEWIRNLEARRRQGPYPCLIVVGSLHAMNVGQVRKLIAAGRSEIVEMNPEKMLNSESRLYFQQKVGEVKAILTGGSHVILTTADEKRQHILHRPQDITALGRSVGDVVRDALTGMAVGGLVMTGGTTAFHILQQIGAEGIEILAEVESGVPAGTILGGLLAGMPVVTKAGGFGSEEVFLKALMTLDQIQRN